MNNHNPPSQIHAFEERDYPSVYAAAGRASARAQAIFRWVFAVDLGIGLTGATLSTLAPAFKAHAAHLGWIGVALILLSVGMSAYLRSSAPERTWFGTRFIAESVKTICWRYVTKSDPFPGDNEAIASSKLAARIASIAAKKKELAWAFLGGETGFTCTQKMTDLRTANWTVRRDVYLRSRIIDQEKWYSTKSKTLGQGGSTIAAMILALQLAVAFSAGLHAAISPDAPNPTGALLALATSMIAWEQTRRFRELSQAYGIAAIDLGLVRSKLAETCTEKDFTDLVADAENAISREHSLWTARRDHT